MVVRPYPDFDDFFSHHGNDIINSDNHVLNDNTQGCTGF